VFSQHPSTQKSSVHALPSSHEAPSAQQATPGGHSPERSQQPFTQAFTVQLRPSSQSESVVQSESAPHRPVFGSQNSWVQGLPSSGQQSGPVLQSRTHPSSGSQREHGGQTRGLYAQQPSTHSSSVHSLKSSHEAPSAQQSGTMRATASSPAASLLLLVPPEGSSAMAVAGELPHSGTQLGSQQEMAHAVPDGQSLSVTHG